MGAHTYMHRLPTHTNDVVFVYAEFMQLDAVGFVVDSTLTVSPTPRDSGQKGGVYTSGVSARTIVWAFSSERIEYTSGAAR